MAQAKKSNTQPKMTRTNARAGAKGKTRQTKVSAQSKRQAKAKAKTQARKQTIKQTVKQTGKQAGKQTKKATKSAKAKDAKKLGKKPAKKQARKQSKKQVVGEGDYQASREFLKDQNDFVARNKDRIRGMGRQAEQALEGPEGDELREAEDTARARARD